MVALVAHKSLGEAIISEEYLGSAEVFYPFGFFPKISLPLVGESGGGGQNKYSLCRD